MTYLDQFSAHGDALSTSRGLCLGGTFNESYEPWIEARATACVTTPCY